MRRRDFIAMAGGAAVAWPASAWAQQKPIVGLLRSTPAAPFAHLVTALQQGLTDAGFAAGQAVAIEQRWADNRLDRLPALAKELIERKVSVIVGNRPAAQAAMAATSTIPIVFVVGDDPVKSGLVESMSRPVGNVTGVTFFAGSQLDAKRMDLLRDIAPKARTIAVLIDGSYTTLANVMPDLQAAANTLGQGLAPFTVTRDSDLEDVFAKAVAAGAGAMLVSGGPLLTSQRQRVVALAAKHAMPAIYDVREFVQAGGLISYAANLADAYRHAGQYAGRILKGDKPSELPVQQATQIEMVINLKTAKALGIAIPLPLQAAADEVIE